MSLCKSIATLSMAYLDDELAAEERHELEAHLTECASCRAHLEQERADLSLIKRSIVAPPASDMLRARITGALNEADRTEQKANRRRWYQYMLPGSAMVAAAAAIALFVGVNQGSNAPRPSASVNSAVKVTKRSLPLEVQGASTGPWLRANFAPVEPPQFVDNSTSIIGARLLPGAFEGRDAAKIDYSVSVDGRRVVVNVLMLRDVKDGEWNEGQLLKVNDRIVRIVQSEDGNQMVSYIDSNHIGYLFIAPELSMDQLISLVGRTAVVGDQ